MQGELEMNNHDINKIKNLEVNGNSSFDRAMTIWSDVTLMDYKLKRLGDGTENTDAVNKGQLDKAVSDSESATRALIETKIDKAEEASVRAAQSENVFLRGNG